MVGDRQAYSDPFREVIKMNIPLSVDQSKSHTLNSTNRESMQTSLYFQNYQSFDGTPHRSHESQNLSASLHSSERVTILQEKTSELYPKFDARNRILNPDTQQRVTFPEKNPSDPRNPTKLAHNLERLKAMEEIRYEESGDSEQEDMPELVQEELGEDLPKNISDLTKEEFIKMMMRESFHSQGDPSHRGDYRSNVHDSVASKKSLAVSQKHQSNQSHINIISNSSSKYQGRT